MTVVHITAVDVGDCRASLHLGYYVDEDHVLRTVELDHREAQATLEALDSGSEWVGYELPTETQHDEAC